MKKQTHLSRTISIADDVDATYDEYVKELLANKQILSRILKYTMEEFADEALEDIQTNIGEIEIGNVYVDPGLTNTKKVTLSASEDHIAGEGEIRFDIRFVAYTTQKECYKILMNIEAQRSTNNSKLGYHLENRMVYYMSRMISAQKETEFYHSDYDSLKKICSIWICMDGKETEDTIEEVRLKKRILHGIGTDMQFDLLRGIVIRLRNDRGIEESKNILIRMLEDLFTQEKAEIKKNHLKHKYGMIMDIEMEGQVKQMCNVSQWVKEMGRKEERLSMVLDYVRRGIFSLEFAASELNITVEEVKNKLKETQDTES